MILYQHPVETRVLAAIYIDMFHHNIMKNKRYARTPRGMGGIRGFLWSLRLRWEMVPGRARFLTLHCRTHCSVVAASWPLLRTTCSCGAVTDGLALDGWKRQQFGGHFFQELVELGFTLKFFQVYFFRRYPCRVFLKRISY